LIAQACGSKEVANNWTFFARIISFSVACVEYIIKSTNLLDKYTLKTHYSKYYFLIMQITELLKIIFGNKDHFWSQKDAVNVRYRR
jgi:hypothetical protein